ncbi:GGDEF domain-containing protein [Amycolatopsis sp. CA-230715]|uniref:GGDEF domain-containing protein n=1 Tax=Amycolatopsis sp. CA-230715 TaxID=2745196 RepID=UPI0020B3C128|nr:diguanylate cyclase [Amycolatopsis sp. CA-230715]
MPRNWALWKQRRHVTAYCLLSEAVAILLTVLRLHEEPIDGRAVALWVTLAVLAVAQAELGRQVERVRRRVAGSAHINMTSVWLFAGVLLLPAVLTAALTVVLYLHLAVRSWYRLHRVSPFRTVSNATILVLTCYASKAVLTAFGMADLRAAMEIPWLGSIAVALALVVHFVVNALLVLPARNDPGRTFVDLFGGWSDNALELATLCLGAFNALALTVLPGLTVLVLPPMLILHRTVLVKQLETAATRDDKTGLLNSAGWHAIADHALAQAERRRTTLGLLMIDLDHFKRVNDTYGHLAGDAVLKAVASAIQSEVRDQNDAVGRFGGEEFVVLLPEISAIDLAAVAERIRGSVREIALKVDSEEEVREIADLSASLGTAMYPAAGTGVQRLLDAADMALYHAKRTGRDRIVHVADLK